MCRLPFVRLPVSALADALGTEPDAIRPALLAARRAGLVEMGLGGGPRTVALKPAAARRLGLKIDGGRWRVRADPPHRPRGPLMRGRDPADHRGREPWEIVAEAEAPDRPALAIPETPRARRPSGPTLPRTDPRPARNSFDLKALRARLEAGEMRRPEGGAGRET